MPILRVFRLFIFSIEGTIKCIDKGSEGLYTSLIKSLIKSIVAKECKDATDIPQYAPGQTNER